MRIIVQKFGGSSLTAPTDRKKAFERVLAAAEAGYRPVVVVSAMGRRGEPYATDTLLELLYRTNPEADGLNTDLLLSCGEIISAAIFAEGLGQLGLPARALAGWQSGIYTDSIHLGARVLAVDGERLRTVLRAGKVPVVAGFQGVTETGEITTLGRGGSDTTAAVLAVVLNAERVEIYSDVDGVKTADPKLVPEAPTLKVLSYREVVELAHMGAKILHPRAAEISMEEGIPIQILSLSDDSDGGTFIGHGVKPRGKMGSERIADRVVTGIAHLGKRAQVKISGSNEFHTGVLTTKIFRLLADAGVSIDLILLASELVAFVIDEEQVDTARKVLTSLNLDVKIEVGFAKVSVVGAGMHGVPGVMARVVGCLEGEQIPIFQTTDSHANISCLILEEHLPRAVRALHKEFQLDRI
ncbi:MAG TPA: aspartate kinase [Firmicutes bacterium]|nr:aspartate kinase [Bacillota bacterium]